ncbi:F420-dependent protein [Williamsia sp. Leaf354]|jgi:PPOX class probable F420-dependent enzyme|uniref:PPOX class F420-dependent oxidoreductase n=1 Tax=Williamsia sp. Leaf354 TaxID=1736349 RepID=UPI0006FFB887|nr:PPOX class F420-dependent oxidoreductase [Williamsia sp. Leaf354]KQR96457.1 F420-dependent protein [Williamsia sp. Leaf354]
MTAYVELSDPVLEYLRTGTRTAHLGYLGSDGRPLVAPVWFVIVDDTVVFATGRTTAKGRALARDPRVTVSIDAPHAPYSFVQIQGHAEFDTRPDHVLAVTTACGARYMGAARAQEFGDRNADENEVAIHIRPVRVLFNPDVTA